ncbi:helix-turn-helix domain-containing protein [Legionella jamestowniensis]|uniref:Putative transcriptional regulator n=1 Tax=Legionella jamestowniensis TaxID=455 RepID=A0A0W0UHN3_9GAMM|nr:helix-turn-helix domain-containing protein [Legionella jamestowniensis]KTD07223.1 putative transcriptional regulator [Legionella jamestowniensis]SFL96054.1 putative transcriptional regulator [Legionella jamestowniensis DSM 19215]
MSKSDIINTMLETAKDLRMNPVTIREIESLNLDEVKILEAAEIKQMRIKEKLSQSVMARILNVTPSTYQKWERGEVRPRGANLKLLRLAHDHGIKYIMS